MNCAIGKDTLFLAICKEALDGAIRETDLLRAVWEVLLNLVVLEFEDLQAVRERGLRRFSLREEVHDLASGEGLLDVLILEEDDLISIGPDLSLDPVREYYLLLAALVELLFLAFSTDHFICLNKVFIGLIRVILFREDQVVVFLLFLLFFLFLIVF